MKALRDMQIELYRILMMFGICLFRAVNSCGHNDLRVSSNLLFCVDTFAFLSGWFGVRFSWKKVLRLYGMGLYAAVVVAGAAIVTGGCERTVSAIAAIMVSCFKGWWFLHAYAVLMAFAALVEPVFHSFAERKDVRGVLSVASPILAVVFVWSFAGELPPLKGWVPCSSGLTAHSGVTLFGVYVVGRLCRLFGLVDRIKIWQWALIFVAMCIIVPERFGFYDSPFVLLMALASFYVFTSINIKAGMKVVRFIAPSCFSIYLLHANEVGLGVMEMLENRVAGVSVIGVGIVVSALAIFVGTILLDLPRRAILRCLAIARRDHDGEAK